MKKLNLKNLLQTSLLLVLFLTANIFPKTIFAADDDRQKVLKIYNWADYIDEDLLKEFPVWYKEQTGEEIKIVYQIFDMPEVMLTKIALGQEDFDVEIFTELHRRQQQCAGHPDGRRETGRQGPSASG